MRPPELEQRLSTSCSDSRRTEQSSKQQPPAGYGPVVRLALRLAVGRPAARRPCSGLLWPAIPRGTGLG